MSLHEYDVGRQLEAQDAPFYALIQAAMRRADSDNLVALQQAFPATFGELQARHDAPGRLLPDDPEVTA